jgi:hypothetical protein
MLGRCLDAVNETVTDRSPGGLGSVPLLWMHFVGLYHNEMCPDAP